MKKYEYKIVEPSYKSDEVLTVEINKLGNDGWKLIAGSGDRLYFRREIDPKRQ